MSLKRGFFWNNQGQLTIFIIVAVFIVAAAVLVFVLRDGFGETEIPASIEPVYNTFRSCLEEEMSTGINVLESQGGYIELPEFEPGSSYMPFSSQLSFAGNPVPYWYYVSGNNIAKEQVPSREEMEQQLAEFIEGEARDCEFGDYYDEGFEINMGEPDAEVSIEDNNVDISLDMDFSVSRGEDSAIINNHELTVNSELGNLYDSAREVYEYEQETLFLENYSLDTLRLYAPVDGVEQTCAPKIWNARDVYEDVLEATEANTFALNTRGDSDDYFNVDVPSGNVRFVTSSDWPNTFEVEPSEENLLVSEPVGNQPGLGILGFCYVPYHFVYDFKYPVMVQIYSNDETFQFPMAVVIDNNKQREGLETNAVQLNQLPQLCGQKNAEITVNVKDSNLNSIDANVSYECFGTKCSIGETEGGSINGAFPQCANGDIIANADGYETLRQEFSTTTDGSVDVFLEKLYNLSIDLQVGGQDFGGRATISFTKNNESETVVYPQQKYVELTEGQYEVQVYGYRNSSITISSSTARQCVDVPQSGIGGFFGFTREKCFNVDFPEQVIGDALAGGGTQNYFITESQLTNADTIQINADSFPVPNSLEGLQDNYGLLEEKGLTISFR